MTIYTDAVAWAAASGIVAGYPDATFAPNRNITRQELVTILFRITNHPKRLKRKDIPSAL